LYFVASERTKKKKALPCGISFSETKVSDDKHDDPVCGEQEQTAHIMAVALVNRTRFLVLLEKTKEEKKERKQD